MNNLKPPLHSTISIPSELAKIWNLKEGKRTIQDLLNAKSTEIEVNPNSLQVKIQLEPLESWILEMK